MTQTLEINGHHHELASSDDTPLLYVLRDELGFDGPLFGCGLAQCGACAVLADGVEIRACITPLAAIRAKKITTIEGLAVEHRALRQAWIDEQVPQCGYCQSGMMIAAASLLRRTPQPTVDQIKRGMNGHLCRCGTQPRIVKAIARAAAELTRA